VEILIKIIIIIIDLTWRKVTNTVIRVPEQQNKNNII